MLALLCILVIIFCRRRNSNVYVLNFKVYTYIWYYVYTFIKTLFQDEDIKQTTHALLPKSIIEMSYNPEEDAVTIYETPDYECKPVCSTKTDGEIEMPLENALDVKNLTERAKEAHTPKTSTNSTHSSIATDFSSQFDYVASDDPKLNKIHSCSDPSTHNHFTPSPDDTSKCEAHHLRISSDISGDYLYGREGTINLLGDPALSSFFSPRDSGLGVDFAANRTDKATIL